MADVPHLVQNLSTALLTQLRLMLSPTVNKYNLSSSSVELAHIEDLIRFQSTSSLLLVPKLTVEDLTTRNHFRKMNVGKALNLYSNCVSAGLQYLVEKEGRPTSYNTTAWFVKLVDSWFNLMSSRHPIMALSKKNSDAYKSATTLLNDFIDVIQDVQFGEKPTWKPVQTGLILSTSSVLELCNNLLDSTLDFLLTSRLTQDCLENLFSVVRSKNPIPTPREFKYALKIICAAQYLKEVKSGNYHLDDREYLGICCLMLLLLVIPKSCPASSQTLTRWLLEKKSLIVILLATVYSHLLNFASYALCVLRP
jgi:hypothetical protein